MEVGRLLVIVAAGQEAVKRRLRILVPSPCAQSLWPDQSWRTGWPMLALIGVLSEVFVGVGHNRWRGGLALSPRAVLWLSVRDLA